MLAATTTADEKQVSIVQVKDLGHVNIRENAILRCLKWTCGCCESDIGDADVWTNMEIPHVLP